VDRHPGRPLFRTRARALAALEGEAR